MTILTQPLISAISDEWYSFHLFGTPGDVVTNLEDLNQSILTILTTPQGSVPHHPDWFSDLANLIDKPVTTVRSTLTQKVLAAIERHESRVTALGVTITPFSDDSSSLRVTVRWRVNLTELESETTAVLG